MQIALACYFQSKTLHSAYIILYNSRNCNINVTMLWNYLSLTRRKLTQLFYVISHHATPLEKGCCSDCSREGKRTWSLVARINDSGSSLPCGIGTRPRVAKGIVIGDPTWCPLHRRNRRPCRRRIGVYAWCRCNRTVCVLYVLYMHERKASDTFNKKHLRSAHHKRYMANA